MAGEITSTAGGELSSPAPLSIAVLADPDLPVPPTHYGGIERVIHLLVEGLHERGHHVVLVAHRASRVSCEVIPYPRDRSLSVLDMLANAATVARLLRRRVDVVHSFGRLACLTPLAVTRTPKFMSYQRAITPSSVRQARRIFGASLEFTACSRQMVDAAGVPGTWHVVYNGVSLARFSFQPHVDGQAPLVFLGRIEEIKGAHLAIAIAQKCGRPLVLAGNIEPAHQSYFDQRIRPHVDGRSIRYVGPVDDRQKNELLGQAGALLMPIVWDEPFGIVMAEALACGTPVIGFRRGSVPEVITHGTTGFVGESIDDLVDGVHSLSRLDRRACRAAAERRFSEQAVVGAYEALYRARCAASWSGQHSRVAV